MTVTASKGSGAGGRRDPRLAAHSATSILFRMDSNWTAVPRPTVKMAPETSPIRSIYMEQRAEANGPTKFEITYSYTARGVFFDLKPEAIGRRT
jgi:hypothetical protein